ncbi:MAG: DUF151 domain-containing protein [Cyclobacteriaceae bacterium]|nr:bifunctional nuclease family protein [Cyclobacteriaceae bacterium]MCH8516472.1 DUF151 domain-containing protein [Cyclobacteriaceae bacterium]
MEKLKLEIFALQASQSQTGSFALILGESSGNRKLPIIIGMFEAQAIAIEIEKIVPNRPMTHDLFKTFANEFNYQVKEVVISDLKEGVFFAKLICSNGEKEIEIDSRPSDAIAIGLRFGVSFYTYQKVLEEAGVELSEEEDATEKQNPVEDKSPEHSSPSKSFVEQLKDFTNDKLNELLDDALKNEDYEKAAKIRDELNKRN